MSSSAAGCSINKRKHRRLDENGDYIDPEFINKSLTLDDVNYLKNKDKNKTRNIR
mgnify:CR=1 FL=1